MMKKIRSGFKLILHGHGVKLNLIGGVLFWLLGGLMLWLPFEGMKLAAILYVMLGPLMLVQVAYTLLYSGIVAASPKRKLIEITIPDWVSVGAVVLSYVIVLISTVINEKTGMVSVQESLESMLHSAGAMALVLIYYGLAYKYYWLGIILFTVTFLAGHIGGIVFFELVDPPLTLLSTSLISLIIVTMGVVLSSLIRRGVYKKALSPMAVGSTLRKALQ